MYEHRNFVEFELKEHFWNLLCYVSLYASFLPVIQAKILRKLTTTCPSPSGVSKFCKTKIGTLISESVYNIEKLIFVKITKHFLFLLKMI